MLTCSFLCALLMLSCGACCRLVCRLRHCCACVSAAVLPIASIALYTAVDGALRFVPFTSASEPRG